MARSQVARWQGSRSQGTGAESNNEMSNHERNTDSFECKGRGEKFSLSSVHLRTHNWIKVSISTSC